MIYLTIVLALSGELTLSAVTTYSATNVIHSDTGITADLFIATHGDEHYGPNYPALRLIVDYQNNYQAHFKIVPAYSDRWEIPLDASHTIKQPVDAPMYDVQIEENPFGILIARKGSGAVLFDSRTTETIKDASFYYGQQYLRMTSLFKKNSYFFGLGERVHEFRLSNNATYTMWATNNHTPYDDGVLPGKNLYGHQPFYMQMDPETAQYHGVLLANSNAQQVALNEDYITLVTIGGVLEFYFFLGPDPESIMQQYQTLVGKPYLTAYWSLGWHQSRWGYANLTMLQDVVDSYNSNDIPLDTMWSDIDYLENYYDFTLDSERFPLKAFAEWVSSMAEVGKTYIPIVEPGVPYQDYFGYNIGAEKDIFVRRYPNSPDYFIGEAWPGEVVFVDWWHPGAREYWWEMLDVLHSQVWFSGIWLDKNEVTHDCSGECPGIYSDPEPAVQLPYTPGERDIESNIMTIRSSHYGGELHSHYNVHPYSPLMQSKATFEYFTQVRKKRSMVITRSSFIGIGAYAGHWLGDNYSDWDSLRLSIPGIFNFQLFGVPFVGADVCGFGDDTTAELCARWMQLGLLYPFSRNHSSKHVMRQEPYLLGKTVVEVSKKFIRLRYQIMLHYYNLMVQAHLNGGSVFRHLMFEFPTNPDTFDLESQFMIGKALMAAPVLTEGATKVDVYFPEGYYYEFLTGELASTATQMKTVSAPIDTMPFYIRGGYSIPTQDPTPALSVVELRKQPLGLLVAVDADGTSSGEFLIDDGESVDSIEAQNYIQYTLQFGPNSGSKGGYVLTCIVTRPHEDFKLAEGEYPTLNYIRVLGVTESIKEVHVRDHTGAERVLDPSKYSQEEGNVYMTGLELNRNYGFALLIFPPDIKDEDL